MEKLSPKTIKFALSENNSISDHLCSQSPEVEESQDPNINDLQTFCYKKIPKAMVTVVEKNSVEFSLLLG
jgi:hypothetical protein